MSEQELTPDAPLAEKMAVMAEQMAELRRAHKTLRRSMTSQTVAWLVAIIVVANVRPGGTGSRLQPLSNLVVRRLSIAGADGRVRAWLAEDPERDKVSLTLADGQGRERVWLWSDRDGEAGVRVIGPAGETGSQPLVGLFANAKKSVGLMLRNSEAHESVMMMGTNPPARLWLNRKPGGADASVELATKSPYGGRGGIAIFRPDDPAGPKVSVGSLPGPGLGGMMVDAGAFCPIVLAGGPIGAGLHLRSQETPETPMSVRLLTETGPTRAGLWMVDSNDIEQYRVGLNADGTLFGR